ncbi:MAG: PilZ domain-containing protein [Candidatus Hermodarchaeia archaeon]|jgi:Tfp pilus assembly protein PilZ
MTEFRRFFPRSGKVIRPQRDAPISTKERRRQTREACTVLVDYTIKEQVYKDFILNITRGGALIATSRGFLPGEEVRLAFPDPISKEHCRITGEIVWEGPQGIGVKFKSIAVEDRELDLYASETDQEQSMQVEKEARKMGKVKKKRVRWEPSTSIDVVSYRLYWSKCGEVNYDSDHADFGHVAEVILPDDIPLFPLKTGGMELGVSAINHAGNESEITKLTVEFNFEVPDAPQNLKVEDI